MVKPLAKRSEANKPVWERGMNPEQLEVILHTDGPICVGAVAGSGKTRALVNRIARLIASGVSEDRICALTFSTKAAEEMNKRLSDVGITRCRVGTWHSFALQILREDHTAWYERTIDKKDRAEYVLKDVIGWKGMNWSTDITKLKSFIGKCKANLYAPMSEEAKALATETFGPSFAARACIAFERYNEALTKENLLTFDDMLVFAAEHLSNEDNRRAWAARFDHVLQDEGQDANGAQDFIGTALAKDHRNYMVVGDVAQSIYAFRGSSPLFLANFTKVWPDAKSVVMNRNYRSGKKVIDVANSIIRPATIRIDRDMIAERPEEGVVKVCAHESLDDEGRAIADTIRIAKEGGTAYSDFTCLYRTNAQSRAIEEALLALRIPHLVVGGVSFYERKEVKDILAYLRVATGKGRVEDIKRCINAPFRYLGAKFVERVMNAASVHDNGINSVDWPDLVKMVAQGERIQARQVGSANAWAALMLELSCAIDRGAMPEATDAEKTAARPSALLSEIVKRTGYIEWLTKEEGEESIENSMGANVREMIRVAERFDTAAELLDFVTKTIKAAREQREDQQAGGNRVLLMSIHRSKGLEWPNVFVCGMNEAILPHGMGDPEEERRLAYVAVTRARDLLVMSYVRRIATKAGIREAHPSRFLADAGVLETVLENPLTS